jgi:hypothetical protein
MEGPFITSPNPLIQKIESTGKKITECDKINLNSLYRVLSEMKAMKKDKPKQQVVQNLIPNVVESPPPSLHTKYEDMFNTYMSKIYTGLDTYNSIYENYKHLVELDKVYVNKTNEYNDYAKKAYVMGLTDNRKTYYSNESIERINFYYRIIFYIYIILVISFLAKILWRMNPDFPFLYKIYIFVLFIILPFIANTIYYLVNEGIKYIQSFFPTAQSPVK